MQKLSSSSGILTRIDLDPSNICLNINVISRARRKWRETVTGDPNKRIRDHMKETPQVKMLDKFSFTLGKFQSNFVTFL